MTLIMRVVLQDGLESEEVLAAALKALGAEIEETSWGVGGAVEESVLRARFAAGEVTIVVRSYEGSIIKGPEAAVRALLREMDRARTVAAGGAS
jgi:hypothetical protein